MADSTAQQPVRAPKKYRAMGASRRTQFADQEGMKYPIHDAKHVRSAISYFSNPKNANKYPAGKRARVWARIKSAAKKFGIEVGEDSGPFAKSIMLVREVPPSYTWMGYDLYPIDMGPPSASGGSSALAQTSGTPPMVAVLGANLAYDPYPLTWVFALKLDDAQMKMDGAYYLEDLDPARSFRRALSAGEITRTDSGNGAPLLGTKVMHVLAPGHGNLDEAHQAINKALPGHSVVDVGWPLYSSREPCPTVMFHSLSSGEDMLTIEPMHRSEEIHTDSDNPPMDGNKLFAGMDPYLMKNEHYTGAEIFEEMQKSLKLMKSVVDMSFPFPDQKAGDGDFDADDTEDGHQMPEVGLVMWPKPSSSAPPAHNPLDYFVRAGVDLDMAFGSDTPSVPGQPAMEPAFVPAGHTQETSANAPAGESFYKCMECNEPVRPVENGHAPAFCKGCGSYLHQGLSNNLPGLPSAADGH